MYRVFALAVLSVTAFSPGWAQNVVCGEQVTSAGAFAWEPFRNGAGRASIAESDASALAVALLELVKEESTSWPADIRNPVVAHTAMLVTGAAAYTDFGISKTDEIPARQLLLRSTANELELPGGATHQDCRDAGRKNALIEAGRFVKLVARSHAALSQPSIVRVARRVEALEAQYDKYLFEGFPMFPWEALINSLVLTKDTIADGPPRQQLVLMHPSAGVVGATGSGSATDVGTTLAVEPLGFIWYGDNHDSWYGISVLAVFSEDRDAGVGIGFNYNNFKLGITWHDYDDEAAYEDPTIFLGIELYQFVGEQHRKYTQYRDKVDALLEGVTN